MKKYFIVIGALAMTLSCAKDIEESVQLSEPQQQEASHTQQTVTVQVQPFVSENETKSTIASDGAFAWASGDQFGVYPLKSSIGAQQTSQQVMFQIQNSSVGTQNSTFTGTGWGLVTGGTYTYFAYYPYDADAEYDEVKITYPDTYTIASNGSTAHIAEDYLVAPQVTPMTSSQAAFNFYHMGALVNFKLELTGTAASAAYNYLELSCTDAIFPTAGTYNPTAMSVTGDPAVVTYPAFTATAKTKKIKINLTNITPTSGYINTYIMLPPMSLSGKTITATLYCTNGSAYKCDRSMSGSIESGKKYNPEFEMAIDSYSGVDLSENETANCYIVNQAGTRYKFNCKVRGNGNDPVTTDSEGPNITGYTSAQITWETVNTDTAPTTSVIESLAINATTGYVYFSTPETFVEGNALISIKDSGGNILWSWHIWATQANLEGLAQTYPNNAGVMMDRNLGALSATPGNGLTLGFHYQWGRPWPITSYSSTSTGEFGSTRMATTNSSVWVEEVTNADRGSLAYSAANPSHFIYASASNYYKGETSGDVSGNWLWTADATTGYTSTTMPAFWGSTKTMYDPCPIGWKVPEGGSTGVWSTAGFSIETFTWNANVKGRTFTSPAAYYPAAGFRGGDGSAQVGDKSGLGGSGFYWSSLVAGAKARDMGFTSSSVNPSSSLARACGLSVRPCRD